MKDTILSFHNLLSFHRKGCTAILFFLRSRFKFFIIYYTVLLGNVVIKYVRLVYLTSRPRIKCTRQKTSLPFRLKLHNTFLPSSAVKGKVAPSLSEVKVGRKPLLFSVAMTDPQTSWTWRKVFSRTPAQITLVLRSINENKSAPRSHCFLTHTEVFDLLFGSSI